jgi:hypothetical protein
VRLRLKFVFGTLTRSLAAGLKFIAFQFHSNLQITQQDNMAAEQRKLLGKNLKKISLVQRKLHIPQIHN